MNEKEKMKNSAALIKTIRKQPVRALKYHEQQVSTGCGKKCPVVFLVIFLAIAGNFEAKFYRFYRFINYWLKSAKEHFIIFKCDKVIGFFSVTTPFMCSRMCAERKTQHVCAAEKYNTAIRTT